MERIDQFDEERAFAPWFFRIVVNDSIKVARKQKLILSLDKEADGSTTQLAKWLVDPSIQPEQVLEQKETRQNILKAMQSLAPEQRAVVVMRYFLELSEAEIVTKTDRPLSTIKWWLREARNRLRRLMDNSQMEDGN
jgi:RNA polymerase sigma-70 factor (ECF subfamily)